MSTRTKKEVVNKKKKLEQELLELPTLFYNRYHRLKLENGQMMFSIYNDETKQWDKWLTMDEFLNLTMPDFYNEKYKETAV